MPTRFGCMHRFVYTCWQPCPSGNPCTGGHGAPALLASELTLAVRWPQAALQQQERALVVGTERLCLLVQEDLVKMRRASSEVLATQRMLETRVANAKREGVSSHGCLQLSRLGLGLLWAAKQVCSRCQSIEWKLSRGSCKCLVQLARSTTSLLHALL